jgi:hypothetical protein
MSLGVDNVFLSGIEIEVSYPIEAKVFNMVSVCGVMVSVSEQSDAGKAPGPEVCGVPEPKCPFWCLVS